MFFSRGKKRKGAVDKVIMGAIIGTAVGSVIGMTVAPKKGKDTRDLLKEKYKNRTEIGQLTKETALGIGTLIRNFLFGKKKSQSKKEPEYMQEPGRLKKIPNEMEVRDPSIKENE